MKIALLILFCATSAFAGQINPQYAQRIADAIYKAEGGANTRHPYGVLIKCKNPRQVCLNTIAHAWKDWEMAGSKGDFIEFLGARYAPVGAANDPHGLNKNWVSNVRRFLK